MVMNLSLSLNLHSSVVKWMVCVGISDCDSAGTFIAQNVIHLMCHTHDYSAAIRITSHKTCTYLLLVLCIARYLYKHILIFMPSGDL